MSHPQKIWTPISEKSAEGMPNSGHLRALVEDHYQVESRIVGVTEEPEEYTKE
jgi:hypothetical protein